MKHELYFRSVLATDSTLLTSAAAHAASATARGVFAFLDRTRELA